MLLPLRVPGDDRDVSNGWVLACDGDSGRTYAHVRDECQRHETFAMKRLVLLLAFLLLIYLGFHFGLLREATAGGAGIAL